MPARIIRALHTFALIRIAYQKHQTGRVNNATQVAGKFGMTVGKFVPSVTVPILPLEGNFLAEEILGKDWKGRKRKDVERKGRASSRCIALPPPPLSLPPPPAVFSPTTWPRFFGFFRSESQYPSLVSAPFTPAPNRD